MDLRISECEVLVIGDEVESVITAVSAARAGAKVLLARRSTGCLGGLSVRGGLSYMDITVEHLAGLFLEFYERAGVIRIALNPDRAHLVLNQMLTEAGVGVISGVVANVELNPEGFPLNVSLSNASLTDGRYEQEEDALPQTSHVIPQVVIDATPDGDVARSLGIPYLKGLGNILGPEQNFLGVSPVFRLKGVSVAELRAFEAKLRQNPHLPALLEKALPFHPARLREEYIHRPTYAPPDQDYLDILNPVIGIDYHIWRHGAPSTYPTAGIAIDGANISRLQDGSLGFNGMVARADIFSDIEGFFGPAATFDDLIHLSQGSAIPECLLAEMRHFETYLRELGYFSGAQVIPPEELYVRQTLTLLSRNNMTARDAITGGVSTEKAVGSFSYWLDLRGTQLWKHYPNEDLPKPVFNVGLDVCLPLEPHLQNFAFVSRSAGYSPIGQGAGRIVQHNSILGEGLGVAAAMAALSHTPLTDVVDHAMPQIQAILAQRRGGQLALNGHASWTAEQIEASELLKQDLAAIERLRESATDFSIL